MEAHVDHTQMILSARRREPGALRALAVSLDEQLVGDDVALDGAVLAWRAVQGERSPGLMGGSRIGSPSSAGAAPSPGFPSPR